MTPSPVSVADAWTRPLFLVWQPIWTPQSPTRRVGEMLTRIRPSQPAWALSPHSSISVHPKLGCVQPRSLIHKFSHTSILFSQSAF
ncbi:hypothetical protein [Sulfobacillus thermosulfidooxidans]|uniref:hypothetical protein n=1 Tax=Sulfobacillus thermosulfidooxidans TaxID=28034 RepID=UPI000491891F|nr:hypothetical protein [Sulfobacillus thermosulfidooxidans]